MQQEFRFGTLLLFPTKELTQIMMASQTINKDGKVEDADQTVLLPTNLIAEVHKRGLKVRTYTFSNESHRSLAPRLR